MQASVCPNHEINEQMCPCEETACSRHGTCCECLAFHATSRSWPLSACMRGVDRPAETLDLPKGGDEKCANFEKNTAQCPCTNVKCQFHAICCDCVRNHWVAGKSLVTCMRGRG